MQTLTHGGRAPALYDRIHRQVLQGTLRSENIMPLKAQLESDTPVRRFFREHFPLVTPLVRKINKSAGSIRVSPSSGDVAMTTIGTAFDYRARAYFRPLELETTVAGRGRDALRRLLGERFARPLSLEKENPQEGDIVLDDGRLARPGRSQMALSDALFDHISEVVGRVSPGEKLPAQHEDEASGACLVLAHLEDCGRNPFGALEEMLLGRQLAEPAVSVASVLSSLTTSEDALRDLRELSWLFYDEWNALLGHETIMNPVFAGSRDVGGADADIIVDGILYDWKVIRKGLRGRDVLQILAYLLLDYEDEHQIRGVGLYSARYGQRWSMGDEDFVRALSDESTPVAAWRDRLRAELESKRRSGRR